MLSWQQADMRNRAGSYGRPPPEASLLSWPTSCWWFLFNNFRKIHSSTQPSTSSSHNLQHPEPPPTLAPLTIFYIITLPTLRSNFNNHRNPKLANSSSKNSQNPLRPVTTQQRTLGAPTPENSQPQPLNLRPFQNPDPSIQHTCCCPRQPNQSPEHKRFPEWVDESADDDASPSAPCCQVPFLQDYDEGNILRPA